MVAQLNDRLDLGRPGRCLRSLADEMADHYGAGMNTTPWWGTALIAGVFGLFGVILAQFITVRLDRARAAREDAQRWQDARRSAYADFLVAVSRAQRLIYDHWDDRNPTRLEDAMAAVGQKEQEAVLIASVRVADAVTTVYVKFYGEFEKWLDGSQTEPETFERESIKQSGPSRMRREMSWVSVRGFPGHPVYIVTRSSSSQGSSSKPLFRSVQPGSSG